MGNTVLVISDFYCLTSLQQREILEACMLREVIIWATVPTLVSSAIKDQEVFANLIESHKNGTAAPPTTPPQNQEMNKRLKTTVTPDEGKPVAFPGYANTPARQKLYTNMKQASDMLPDPIDAQAQNAATTNNTDGNKFRSAEWTNINQPRRAKKTGSTPEVPASVATIAIPERQSTRWYHPDHRNLAVSFGNYPSKKVYMHLPEIDGVYIVVETNKSQKVASTL